MVLCTCDHGSSQCNCLLHSFVTNICVDWTETSHLFCKAFSSSPFRISRHCVDYVSIAWLWQWEGRMGTRMGRERSLRLEARYWTFISTLSNSRYEIVSILISVFDYHAHSLFFFLLHIFICIISPFLLIRLFTSTGNQALPDVLELCLSSFSNCKVPSSTNQSFALSQIIYRLVRSMLFGPEKYNHIPSGETLKSKLVFVSMCIDPSSVRFVNRHKKITVVIKSRVHC